MPKNHVLMSCFGRVCKGVFTAIYFILSVVGLAAAFRWLFRKDVKYVEKMVAQSDAG